MTEEEEVKLTRALVVDVHNLMVDATQDKSPMTRDTMIASAFTQLITGFIASRFPKSTGFGVHDELYKVIRQGLRKAYEVLEDK